MPVERVIIFSPMLHAGGAERAAREQAQDLRALGLEVTHAVAMARPGEAIPPGVRALAHPRERLLFPLDHLPIARDRWHLGMDHALAEVDTNTIDLVHIHNIHGRWVSRRAIAALSERVPTVWTLHDEWAPSRGMVYDLRRITDREDARRTDRAAGGYLPLAPGRSSARSAQFIADHRVRTDLVITPSDWLAAYTRVSGAFGDTPVRTIPNGVRMLDLPESTMPRGEARKSLGLDERTPVVMLIAGALDQPHKGVARALEAARAAARNSDFALLVAGAGHEAIIGAARRNAAGTTIIDKGLQSSDDAELARCYRAATFTVIPSLLENAPYTVLESFACGTPVAGFDNDGMRELIGTTGTPRGMLATPNDPEALANILARLLRDGENRESMGRAARAWVSDRCRPESCARALQDAYAEAADRFASIDS